jgi:hypothetical protein
VSDERIREMIRAGRVAYGVGIDLPDRAAGEELVNKEHDRVARLYNAMLASEPDLPELRVQLSFALA